MVDAHQRQRLRDCQRPTGNWQLETRNRADSELKAYSSQLPSRPPQQIIVQVLNGCLLHIDLLRRMSPAEMMPTTSSPSTTGRCRSRLLVITALISSMGVLALQQMTGS